MLTPGTDRTTSEYPGDHDEGTRHYGAFVGTVNLACATCLLSHWKDGPAWQLRGMATAPTHRGKGIGSALLAFAERDLRETSDIPEMWCNARLRAVPFYVRMGWTVVSEEFLIPGVGPHKRLVRRIHL